MIEVMRQNKCLLIWISKNDELKAKCICILHGLFAETLLPLHYNIFEKYCSTSIKSYIVTICFGMIFLS